MNQSRYHVSLQNYHTKYRDVLQSFDLPKNQEKFSSLPGNLLSIKEGQFPIVILHEDTPVGFFILNSTQRVEEYTTNPNALLLTAFSINYKQQGKGFAKKGLLLLEKYIKEHFPTCNEVVLGVNYQNIPAQSLYLHVGFHDTGRRVIGSLGEQFVMSMPI